MYIFIFFILFLYIVLIVTYIFGWKKNNISKVNFNDITVSVVVAMRNEELNIFNLINDIKKQDYPKKKWELVIVNDHSTDNSLNIATEHSTDNVRVINMKKNDFGKKKALTVAVETCKSDIILVTDADCRVKTTWIRKMVNYFNDQNINLVAGPVVFKNSTAIITQLQSLEFASLIGSSAGAIGINNAILCNGANMAYRKNIFLKFSNYNMNSIASGDDVFLLHNIKKEFPKSIVFAKDEDSIVETNACDTVTDFINQRKRWAAKSVHYKDFYTRYVSYVVFLTNFIMIIFFLASFFNLLSLKLFFLFFLLKFFIDMTFLYSVLKFFNRIYLIKWIFFFEIVYSFYIVLISLLSLSSSFDWKGRIHKR